MTYGSIFIRISYLIQIKTESYSRLQSIITAFQRSESKMFMKSLNAMSTFSMSRLKVHMHELVGYFTNSAYINIRTRFTEVTSSVRFYKGEQMKAMKKRYRLQTNQTGAHRKNVVMGFWNQQIGLFRNKFLHAHKARWIAEFFARFE